jgi:hypothetical protein
MAMSKLAPTPVDTAVIGRRRAAPWLRTSRSLALCVAAWLAAAPVAAFADGTQPGEPIAGDGLAIAVEFSASTDSFATRVLPAGFAPDAERGLLAGAPAPYVQRGRDTGSGQADLFSPPEAIRPATADNAPVGLYRWLSRHFKLGLRYSREPFADGLSEPRGDDHTVFVSFVGHLD